MQQYFLIMFLHETELSLSLKSLGVFMRRQENGKIEIAMNNKSTKVQ